MTDEQKQEVNRQTLDLLGQMLSKDSGQIIFFTYRKPDGKINCAMGYGITYLDMVEAFKELGESLEKMVDLIKKAQDGN
jgi:hypothetical protein